MASTGSFMVGGVVLFPVVGVARRGISLGITGIVHKFVSITARKATLELIARFSFLARCRTLHP